MAREHWLDPPEWWKKWKPLRWATAAGVIFVIVSGTYTAKVIIEATGPHAEAERFTEQATDTVVFLDGMTSFESLENIQAKLDAAKVQYSIERNYPRKTSKYPPRDRDTLLAPTYAHLGVEGHLTLEFFNNRLYEATFIPSDPAVYAEKLHAADPRLKRDRAGRVERITGDLRIASNVDFATTEVGTNLKTKPYVIWQDLRLTQLLDEWDRRFVALPPES